LKIGKEEALALKLAVKRIHETPEGQLLLDYFDEITGKYAPTYDPSNPTSIALEAGRRELVAIIHNIERLTEAQIVEYFKKG